MHVWCESKLAWAYAIIVDNVVHISIQPVVIFYMLSEITLWGVHVRNANISHKNMHKNKYYF